MSQGQQFDQQDDHVLPTKSPAWNCLEVVRSRLSSRLASFTRDRTVDGRHRPQKQDNNAAFFETDLRNVFRTTPVVAYLSPAEYTDMDLKAAELLESLDKLVNGHLIDTEDEQDPKGWEPESNGDVPVPDDAAILRDDYPRLYALIIFLQDAEGMLNLAIGPGSPIFMLPPGAVGDVALDRVAKWKELLERLMADPRKSHGIQLSERHMQLSAELTEIQPGVLEKRASTVIGAMFKEFRRLNCANGGETHEIKVPGDLYTKPLQPVLDMLVSRCRDTDNKVTRWQEAACGAYQVLPDKEKRDMCSAIERAQCNNRKLYLFVDQERGLLDISDKIPPAPSTARKLKVKSLSRLLRDKCFHEAGVRDMLQNKVDGKFGSHKKAVLALALARCLMDFIDEELELASYSWNPKKIFFLYPKSTTASDGTLYISLRPKTAGQQSSPAPAADLIESICPGNPVLLTFARLLLEIYGGDELSLEIDHDNTKRNLTPWANMCSVLGEVEKKGSNHFLSAVKGCLYLHLYLHLRLQDERRAGVGPGTAGDLRRVMYENIVHNLELMVYPDSIKRKRVRDLDNVADLPPSKKVSVSPMSTNLVQREAIPTASPVEDLMRASGTVTLYDDMISWKDSEKSKRAEVYFSYLDRIKQTFILPLVNRTVETEDDRLRRPVRVAILDSGVDMLDPYVKGAAKRIKAKRNWTDDNPENWEDIYGHGTHVARLLIRVAPAAEIYIARVSTAKEIDPEKTGRIAEAINYAATEWNVDIISLSLGLEKDHQKIDFELERVLFPSPGNGRKRIVIAAAANWAGNQDIAYPARRQNVICIHATDGGGNPSKYNPTARKGHKHNFALLGSSIESRKRVQEDDSTKLAFRGRGEGALAGAEGPAATAGLIRPKPKREKVWISGTSYATPIAAGVAANVLEFARHHAKLTPGEWEGIYSWSGMSRIFKAMSDERQHYDYIRPWIMFNTEYDPQTIVKSIRKILNE